MVGGSLYHHKDYDIHAHEPVHLFTIPDNKSRIDSAVKSNDVKQYRPVTDIYKE